MQRLLTVIPLVVLLLAGCGKQEMAKVEKCVKIVEMTYYQTTFLGIPMSSSSYWVLADGRKIRVDSEVGMWGRDGKGNICTTEFQPKK